MKKIIFKLILLVITTIALFFGLVGEIKVNAYNEEPTEPSDLNYVIPDDYWDSLWTWI